MTKLSPSVLSADFACLAESCRSVLEAGADMIHYDVMDGHFVDNISFGLPVLESLKKALPQAIYDVHLMITHPLRYAADFAKAGADYITFNVETTDDIQQTIDAIRAAGCKPGMSLKPDTPVEALFPWLDQLSLVLVMGVEPGHGGQAFLNSALDKLAALRAECRRRGLGEMLLSVDGGVKLGTTGPACVAAGANLLVAGSAVFCAQDKAKAVAEFRSL